MQKEILERLLREALLKRNQKKQERENNKNRKYNYQKQEYEKSNKEQYNNSEKRHPLWKYHMVLGVSVHSTKDEIKSAYRKLALKYHPDKNKSPDAELQIRQLNQAAEMRGII
jgi:DnaJ-domain-containing protein 1